jgi:hypothetical protein
MKQELKRIDPLRAANVSALVYGLLTGVFALIFAPIFVVAMLFAPEGAGVAGMMLPAFAVVLNLQSRRPLDRRSAVRVRCRSGVRPALTTIHRNLQELQAALELIRQSPRNDGVVELIARRPRVGEREVLQEAELDLVEGLVGDNWKARGSSGTPNGAANPGMQLNIMNSRVTALVAIDRRRWSLAGDQLYLDLDLSAENLPPGTRLSLGSAVIEVTDLPHTGCKKFVSRFGVDAMKFVNSPVGRQLNLRGINARVAMPGRIRGGDVVRKV